MIARISLVIASGLALSGCATTIKPVAIPLSEQPPNVALSASLSESAAANNRSTIYANVPPRNRLQYLVCALHSKSGAHLAQAQRWQNRTEWQDIPLIGAAATVAGLLLFGEQNSGNALKKGEQDTIAGGGFGASAFLAVSNDLSPQKARDLLRQGARGHFCLATQGELILSVYGTIGRPAERRSLAVDLAELSGELAGNPAQFDKPEETKVVRDAAATAIATDDSQIMQLDTAGVTLGETARNFVLNLMTRTHRDEQNVDILVKAITEQTASVTKFATMEQKAADPVPKAVVQSFITGPKLAGAQPTIDQLTIDVANETALLMDGLVDVEASVLGFDKCAATHWPAARRRPTEYSA